jgi:hypothetical protein
MAMAKRASVTVSDSQSLTRGLCRRSTRGSQSQEPDGNEMRDRTRTVNVELCVWKMTGISLTVGVRESLLSRLARRGRGVIVICLQDIEARESGKKGGRGREEVSDRLVIISRIVPFRPLPRARGSAWLHLCWRRWLIRHCIASFAIRLAWSTSLVWAWNRTSG